MSVRFDRALVFVLRHEGGYVFDPNDPGGETNYGISKRSYPEEDIKGMTKQRAAEIYYRDYWVKAGCESMADPLAFVHFDTAVNMGLLQANKILSRASMGAYSIQINSHPTAMHYLDRRRAVYASIVAKRPASVKYLKGWLNRVDELEKECYGTS